MIPLQLKDSRGNFMLPQAPESAGYYTYGTPGNGQGQFSTPKLLTLIFNVERRWSETDNRKFGVGNISMAGGGSFKGHQGHRNGLHVDIRPLRKDGKPLGVTALDSQYDKEATKRLIRLFWDSNIVSKIYFGDASIPNVTPLAGHFNHFHVEVMV